MYHSTLGLRVIKKKRNFVLNLPGADARTRAIVSFVYACIYMYIYIEREIHTHTHIHTCICIAHLSDRATPQLTRVTSRAGVDARTRAIVFESDLPENGGAAPQLRTSPQMSTTRPKLTPHPKTTTRLMPTTWSHQGRMRGQEQSCSSRTCPRRWGASVNSCSKDRCLQHDPSV